MATYIKIASATVGAGGAASIDFTSIPNTYTDLLIKISGRADVTAVYNGIYVQFNNDTGANYSQVRAFGTGTSVAGDVNAAGSTNGFLGAIYGSGAGSAFGNTETYIPNYASSSQKSISSDSVTEFNGSGSLQILQASFWNGTAAITSLKIFGASCNFVQYSTATLYGIKKN